MDFIGSVCVCVMVPFILEVWLVNVPAGVTQEEGHTGGRSHRITPPFFCGDCLNFSREKDSAVYIIYFVRKNPISCDCTEIRIQVPTSEGFEVTNSTSGGDRCIGRL